MGKMEPYANATETRHPGGMDEEERGSFLNQRVVLKLHLHERPLDLLDTATYLRISQNPGRIGQELSPVDRTIRGDS